jgi:hypothetical protein
LRHAIAAGLAGLLFAQAASADSVSGQFELDGKALTPSEVAAFRIRDQFNPREFITYVMLTTRPVQREAIAADSDPYTAAINDDAAMHADYLAFFVRANGETSMNAHVGGTQYLDSSGKIMGQRGSLLAECTENTAQRVACTVKVAKPVKSMDGPGWSVDVSFDSAVLSRPAGKPLPKDGGEPGQTLLALVAAAQGDDLSKIIALLTPGEAEDYQRDYNTPEENLANAKQMFDFTLPKQPKITGGELLDDNTALLEVEGVPYEGTRILYLVRIERHDGRWGYASSQRVGMLD